MPFTLLVIGFLLLILVVAGYAQTREGLRPFLYFSLLFINLMLIVIYGVLAGAPGKDGARIPMERSVLALTLSIGFASVASMFLFRPVRLRLRPIFTSAFNPDSLPQMTALVFCVYMLADTVLNFVVSGGLSGLAQDFEGVKLDSLILNVVIFSSVALVGAGFPGRRNWTAVAQRLGLRWPTIEELAVGFLVAIGLIFAIFVIGIFWSMTQTEKDIESQTQLSRLISNSVNTLTFAFIVSMSAAVGEEIAFRGALQPVFGLWPTAIFFALTHIQYTLTPATLVIIMVGLGLGWVRKRYNTTAAILTHFTYDFALFFLTIYGSYLQDMVKSGALR